VAVIYVIFRAFEVIYNTVVWSLYMAEYEIGTPYTNWDEGWSIFSTIFFAISILELFANVTVFLLAYLVFTG